MNLWAVSAANPRRKARSRKARSPAQRAATARMLAANRAKRGPAKRRTARRSKPMTVATRARTSVRRMSRRASRAMSGAGRSASMRNLGGSALAFIKGGAIGAGGAIGVDLAMGFVGPMLPATFAAKLSADGSPNYGYYAAKGAMAMAVGILGAKVVRGDVARQLAAGSFTVMAYELLRPIAASMLPASMTLGYMSPGRVMNSGMAQYQSTGLGRLGVYNNVTPMNKPGVAGYGRGAAAARRMG